ncbi:MAG: hypothetical protein RM347_011280 [Nostoc sp. ChiQUE02]|uniref:hypothetical protein n=1 Tax=Nostoc sp. ChiQUE02 TaxID=3075377 RepID=UPI002AD3F672|nr:hypothetical protein [Nostoc sp. ChiQUE02]MDZ8235023.1 hypothetical protein [Nostoc sp. ChiQUE02]
MQNLSTSNTIGLSLELFHVQTNTAFELSPDISVFHIGKPNEQIPPNREWRIQRHKEFILSTAPLAV